MNRMIAINYLGENPHTQLNGRYDYRKSWDVYQTAERR